MNTAAVYHRPESEFAYLFTENVMHIRLRTARDDMKEVAILKGDPYQFESEQWYLQSEPMRKYLSTDLYDYWVIETSAEFRRLQYAFRLEGRDGLTAFYGDHGVYPYEEEYYQIANFYFRMPYFQEIDRFKTPDWVKKTVWYQIFPERFANGDPTNDPAGTLPWSSKAPDREDFFGGDLQGVLDHLDYLEELGINGIYFCPIFKATSNHKYDTIDYFEIDPDFGDKDLFRRLVAACHARGIRVMLDAVFNHIGDDSPQWQDVLAKGADSDYVDWFHIHSFPITYEMTKKAETAKNLSYDTFAFTPHMPKLNTANPEVQEYLLSIARYWVAEFDIDAWRLDVANEVDHHFWKRFHQEMLVLKPDFYILGEIWHSSQAWLNGDEFHGVMNYAFTETIEHFFVDQTISLPKMIGGLNEQLMLYRSQTNQMMFNSLDSHDTARILTMCEGNQALVKQVLAFMFMHPGAPCIYYGTEIGMSGENDPDCRKCMIWDEKSQDQDMLAYTKQLIDLRKTQEVFLSYGELVWEYVDEKRQVVGISRVFGDQAITGYFNCSAEDFQLQIEGKRLLELNCQHLSKKHYSLSQQGFVIYLDRNPLI